MTLLAKAPGMKKALRRLKRPKPILMNFKATLEEREEIKALAKKYANGNLSLWMVFASLHFRPSKKDMT